MKKGLAFPIPKERYRYYNGRGDRSKTSDYDLNVSNLQPTEG